MYIFLSDKKDEEKQDGGFTTAGGGRGGSANKKTLTNVKTHFYIGTEVGFVSRRHFDDFYSASMRSKIVFQDGELVYCDWMPQKDQDSGKIQSQFHTLH